MSNYTEKMVAQMEKIGSFDYASAEEFASKNGLTTRSVISKAKSLGLDYTPRVVAKAATPRICLLYTSPSPRDVEESRMPSSA